MSKGKEESLWKLLIPPKSALTYQILEHSRIINKNAKLYFYNIYRTLNIL